MCFVALLRCFLLAEVNEHNENGTYLTQKIKYLYAKTEHISHKE